MGSATRQARRDARAPARRRVSSVHARRHSDEATDDLKGHRSLCYGPEPTIIGASSAAMGPAEIVAWIEACKCEGIEENEVCVLARTNDLVRATSDGLKAEGYSVTPLQRRAADDRTKPGIRACTMHRAKGLEFAAVAIVDVNTGIVPPR